MKTCRRCRALYTGHAREGFCPACTEKIRRSVYADPRDSLGWLTRQNQRFDLLRALLAHRRDPADVEGLGYCPKCSRTIDDHELTYYDAPYPVARCKPPAPAAMDIP